VSIEGRLLDWAIAEPTMPRLLPVDMLSKRQAAGELQRVQQRRAADAAYEAELILRMADLTPDATDPPPDHPGARSRGWAPDTEFPGVSEFFPNELAVVLGVGRGTAAHRLRRAWVWRESLPATWAAMRNGELDERRGGVLADALAYADPQVARMVEARLLPQAAGLSLTGLKEQAIALLLELDADAVDRSRRQARASADVRAYPSHLQGMAVLTADLPAEEAAACYALVDSLARMLKADGDPRPIGALRAAVVGMLILRPADHGLPGATITLTVTAALDALAGESNQPGSVNGLPITAGHLRELLTRVGALGLTSPQRGSLAFALTDDDGELLATLTLAQLQALARRGCPTHPESDCDCAVSGRPDPTDAYQPTDGQQTFVKTRDRRCRFPNCGQRVGWADLDHVIAHACGGQTACENLCCLCRSHHRLKTFAPGWQFAMDDDGTLHVTTPSGITRTTRPPGRIEHDLHTAADLRITDPPPEPWPPRGGTPPPQATPDDDPPPF
jgi:hypothetical protein